MKTFKCKWCGEESHFTDEEFEEFGEALLWGHFQIEHEEVFEEIQNMDTPDMIDEVYEVKEIEETEAK